MAEMDSCDTQDNIPKGDARYKRFTMYNAETGKQFCTSLKRANFKSDEELNAHIAALRRVNRERNAAVKKLRERTNLENKMRELAGEQPITPGLGTQPQVVAPIDSPNRIPTMLPEQLIANPVVNLRLDENSGNTTLILGSSKRGKSTLMMHLYDRYYSSAVDKKSINTLYSGNPQLKIYRNDRNLIVADGFTAEHAKYIQMQKYINTKTKNKYKFCNLFDDIIDQKHSRIINQMVLSYRNSNISLMICLQYMFAFSKANRANVNNTFVFGANNAEDEENLIKHVLKPYFVQLGYKEYNTQVMLFRECTKNYGFFYIDNLKNKISAHRLLR